MSKGNGDLAALIHFVGHVIAGVVTFVLVAASVGLLHILTKWLASTGVSAYIINALVAVEYAIFAMDIILMGFFLITTGIKFVKELCK